MRKEGLLFSLVLLSFVSLILLASFGFTDYKTKVLPLLVGTVTLVLGLLTLAVEISPRFRSVFEVNLFKIQRVVEEKGDDNWSEMKGFLMVFLWLLLFCLLLFFLGFYVGVLVCVFLFVKLYGNESWAKSLVITAITLISVYGLFRVLMGVRLFKGILFGEII